MIKQDIDKEILALSKQADKDLETEFKKVDEIAFENSNKILTAFIKNKVSYTDFADINGYGNYDTGRDKLEKIFSYVLGTQDALVRPQIMSGTNALYLAFTALLKHGETMISLTGKPYDSLQEMIGIVGKSTQSLKSFGIKYEQINLLKSGFDTKKIVTRLSKKNVRLVEIQRSRGYSNRPSLSIKQIGDLIKEIRKVNKDVIIMVDNCYGELVETKEPGHVGANIVVGSLMKNLGGGIASTGGYIAGDKKLIHEVAERLTAPGIAKEQGANFNQNNNFFKGIFMAPAAVKNAVKTQIFASYMLEKLGFEKVSPKWNEARTDIIQTVELKTKENLVKFTQGIQESSPVDSYVRILPAPMPGYPFDEVMAAGSFTQGSTIELSADAPVIEPYTLYMQGGLTSEYGKLGVMLALTKMRK